MIRSAGATTPELIAVTTTERCEAATSSFVVPSIEV